MSGEIADEVLGLIEILQADADVSAITSGRIFGMTLPRDEAGRQPRAAITIQPSGGPQTSFTSGTLPVQAVRVDIRCYAETIYLAGKIRRTVHRRMRVLYREVSTSGILIHSANPAGGPTVLRDPDGDWPIVVAPWQVFADERTT